MFFRDCPDATSAFDVYGSDHSESTGRRRRHQGEHREANAGDHRFRFGLYLVVRAMAEPFTIDMTDPATYQDDWGGPSLLGVLAIHCGPGGCSPPP